MSSPRRSPSCSRSPSRSRSPSPVSKLARSESRSISPRRGRSPSYSEDSHSRTRSSSVSDSMSPERKYRSLSIPEKKRVNQDAKLHNLLLERTLMTALNTLYTERIKLTRLEIENTRIKVAHEEMVARDLEFARKRQRSASPPRERQRSLSSPRQRQRSRSPPRKRNRGGAPRRSGLDRYEPTTPVPERQESKQRDVDFRKNEEEEMKAYEPLKIYIGPNKNDNSSRIVTVM